MPWQMQVKIEREGQLVWVSVAQTGKPPYEYPTENEAWRMLNICYPDQCGERRLFGSQDARVRVVEVP